MKRRVYVAVSLSRLAPEAQALAAKHPLPVRWIAGKNLHITLIPPWYEEDVARVKEKLRKIEYTRFDIAFNTISYGPARQPRLIWAEGEATPEVVELQKRAEGLLGMRADHPFKLHMTLARFRPEEFRKLPPFRERVVWNATVDSVVLMESHLSSEGADYEVLEEVRFQ